MKVPRAILLLIVALAALLPSCGGERSTIRLWHAYRGDEERALGEILAAWKGAPIEVLPLPYDAYASKLSAAIPLGEGPDLFIDTHERLGDYKHRRLVANVGDALEPAVFTKTALDAVTVGGVALAVPLSQKCQALYVNTDLAREVPPDLEGIAALRASLPPHVFPLAFEAQGAYGMSPLFAAFGGKMLEPGDRYGFTGAPAERALRMTRDLIAARAVPEGADGALVTDLFRTGKAAFAISGPWMAASLGDKVKYRVVPLPMVRAAGAPMRPLLTVESVMLSPGGAARAEVRALARLIAGREAAVVRARLGPTPSARTDVPLPEGDAPIRAFAAQAREAEPMSSSRAMRAVWEPVDNAIREYLRGNAAVEAALAAGAARYARDIRPLPGKASPIPLLLVIGLIGVALALRWAKAARGDAGADLRAEIRRSLPAYKWIAHAVVTLLLLVILPLVMGAATSLFAGSDEDQRYVGLANFIDILSAQGGPLLASGSFYVVLAVTLLWTVVNVAFHLGIGVALALVLSRPFMRLRAAYRVLLIVPWAVPSYVTALAWKGMFQRQFGALTGLILGVNHVLGTHLEPIEWFAKFSTAFAANVATNVWLGFPFMMVVTLGALTAVPADVLEAARVDGATRWQRLRLVTLPIIRPTLAPAVTLGAMWTFNMFNVVFLVSGGDPNGTTDILVSEAYRWAFTRQNQYGYAAAYAVLIFLLLFGATRLSSRWSDDRSKPVAGAGGS